MLPLYKNAQDFIRQNNGRNLGLYFDKFCDKWVETDDEQNGYKLNLSATEKKDFFTKITEEREKEENQLLKDYLNRRYYLIRALDGRILHSRTLWRFVSGLGAAHPTETGFVWHRTLGVPYLPASSLKGMLRAWLKHWENDGKSESRIRELFGDPETGQGRLIIFDALPLSSPVLDIDIMNPHYTPYYDNPEKNPPGDYYSPNPVYFLTVAPKQKFEFVIAPNYGLGSEADLKEGVVLLKRALSIIGCGAKTAVGYGVFEENFLDQTKAIFQKLQEEEEKRELEGLTPFEQQCHRLKKGLKHIDRSKLKEESMKLFYKLDDLNETEKITAAQTLKQVWQELGEWEGKLSAKQMIKVVMVKNILKDN